MDDDVTAFERHRTALVDAIELWRNNVLDCDVVVDDHRQAFNTAWAAVRVAEQDRALAVQQLALLIDQYRTLRRPRPEDAC